MKTDLDATDERVLQEKLKLRLLEMGLLSEIKPPVPPQAIPKDRTPFQVEGNPVSDLIIKERR